MVEDHPDIIHELTQNSSCWRELVQLTYFGEA